jgi:hypothetical protein
MELIPQYPDLKDHKGRKEFKAPLVRQEQTGRTVWDLPEVATAKPQG